MLLVLLGAARSDALWSNTANWSVSPVPGLGDTATFNAAAGVGGAVITTGNISLGTLVFDTSSAAAYTIGGASAGTGQITFGDGTTSIVTMNSTVANNQLINANIILGTAIAGTNTITNASTTKTLTIAGSITGGTGGTAAAKTLTIAGAGQTILSGTLSKGGATSLTINSTATGQLTLSGAGSIINTLNLAATTGGQTVVIGASGITINNGGANGIFSSSTSGTNTISGGTITLGANGDNWGTATGSTLVIGNKITGPFSFESFTAANSTGVMQLTNATNDYTGDTQINSGVLSVAVIGNSGVAGNIAQGLPLGLGRQVHLRVR